MTMDYQAIPTTLDIDNEPRRGRGAAPSRRNVLREGLSDMRSFLSRSLSGRSLMSNRTLTKKEQVPEELDSTCRLSVSSRADTDSDDSSRSDADSIELLHKDVEVDNNNQSDNDTVSDEGSNCSSDSDSSWSDSDDESSAASAISGGASDSDDSSCCVKSLAGLELELMEDLENLAAGLESAFEDCAAGDTDHFVTALQTQADQLSNSTRSIFRARVEVSMREKRAKRRKERRQKRLAAERQAALDNVNDSPANNSLAEVDHVPPSFDFLPFPVDENGLAVEEQHQSGHREEEEDREETEEEFQTWFKQFWAVYEKRRAAKDLELRPILDPYGAAASTSVPPQGSFFRKRSPAMDEDFTFDPTGEECATLIS